MPSLKRRTEKPVQWWIEDLAHRMVDGLAARLSGPAAYHLGEWIGSLAWHLVPKRRRIVIRNLRIVFGTEKSSDAIVALAKDTFRRTGANLISVAHTASLPIEDIPNVFKVRNPELVIDTAAQGKGLIILLSHMGNWELLSRISHLFPVDMPNGAYYRPLNNPRLDTRVRQRREADGVTMFSKKDNPLRVGSFIRDGAAVGILADQRVGPKGDPVRLFGRFTRASPLPSLLARRAKCPALALIIRNIGPGVWEGEFLTVDDPTDTASCMRTLEHAMRAAPAEVFWFQDRWKTYLSESRTPADWIGDGSSEPNKRHRALVWAVGSDHATPLPDGWSHPDVDYEWVIDEREPLPAHLPADTPVHRFDPSAGSHAVRNFLHALEWSAALPVDFVVTRRASKELRKACRDESIPLISLP